MRDLQHITTQAELEELIGQYFEGETTIEEENAMRQVLAHCSWSSDTIDEALFAMGYFSFSYVFGGIGNRLSGPYG